MAFCEKSYLLSDLANEDIRIELTDKKYIKRELTKEELEYYTAEPTWIRVRLCLFWTFWAVLIAVLFASIVIVISSHRSIQIRNGTSIEHSSIMKFHRR